MNFSKIEVVNWTSTKALNSFHSVSCGYYSNQRHIHQNRSGRTRQDHPQSGQPSRDQLGHAARTAPADRPGRNRFKHLAGGFYQACAVAGCGSGYGSVLNKPVEPRFGVALAIAIKL